MDDLDVDVLAGALGVVLRPEWRAGVRLNLVVSLRLAAEVAAFPLDDDVALAGVFRA